MQNTKNEKRIILFPFIILLIVCIFSIDIQSQDVHFSHRLASFTKKNPALMGNYEGNWRAIIDHRRQWQSVAVPFLTSALHYNHKIYPTISGNKIIAGINYINDESGDAKLSINHIELAGAYEYDYFENTFIGGFQIGYSHKQFSDAKLSFPQQYDRNIGDFNTDISSGENFSGYELSYFDFNIGFAWKKTITKKLSTLSGFSVQHLNQPKHSFINNENYLDITYGIQLMAFYQWLPKTQLRPSLDYLRNSAASELIIGSNIYQKIKDAKIKKVFGGLHARNGFGRNIDAIILNGGIGYKNFDFGVSYDFNVSDLQLASNYKGGIEFLLIISEITSILQQKTIPCERF